MSSPYDFADATFQVGDEDPVAVESVRIARDSTDMALLLSSRVVRDSISLPVPKVQLAGIPSWANECQVCEASITQAHRLIGWFCPRVFFALRDQSLEEALLAVDLEMCSCPDGIFPGPMRSTCHSHPVLWELLYRLSHLVSDAHIADDNCRLGFNALVRNIIESSDHEQGDSLCHCPPF